MGMGNYPNYADTVTIDFVKEMCPEEWGKFNLSLLDGDIDFDAFCQCTSIDDELDTDESQGNAIDKAYDALIEAFNNTTGLELGVVHHDKDDRGDELDGGAFSVDGVYGLTEAGKKHIKKIVRKAWSVFG